MAPLPKENPIRKDTPKWDVLPSVAKAELPKAGYRYGGEPGSPVYREWLPETQEAWSTLFEAMGDHYSGAHLPLLHRWAVLYDSWVRDPDALKLAAELLKLEKELLMTPDAARRHRIKVERSPARPSVSEHRPAVSARVAGRPIILDE